MVNYGCSYAAFSILVCCHLLLITPRISFWRQRVNVRTQIVWEQGVKEYTCTQDGNGKRSFIICTLHSLLGPPNQEEWNGDICTMLRRGKKWIQSFHQKTWRHHLVRHRWGTPLKLIKKKQGGRARTGSVL